MNSDLFMNAASNDENVISLQEIIDKLDIKAKLTAYDYMQTEDDYSPVNVLEMTEEDIIDLIKQTGKVENNDNILEDSICDNLTITETVNEEVPNVEHCKSLLEQIETFFNNKKECSKKDMDAIYFYKKRIDDMKRMKQATLDNFITKAD